MNHSYSSRRASFGSENSLLEVEASALMYQFLQGLKVMHDMQVAHRDIKPQNALLVDKYDASAFKADEHGSARAHVTPRLCEWNVHGNAPGRRVRNKEP